jgi:putative SOS response-associated peptidase YedK
MCFHNSLTANAEKLSKRFSKAIKKVDFEPIYHGNAFDKILWPVIIAQQPNEFEWMQWGLIPNWAKSLAEAQQLSLSTFNAKIETLSDKPSFRYTLQSQQRCIVPSTGFFEWQTMGKNKYPYLIRMHNEEIFGMAGIWEKWQNPINSADIRHSFSIVTTEANPLMATIHNTKKRMPVILTPDNEYEWIERSSSFDLTRWAQPIDDRRLEAFTIGRLISNTKTNTNIAEVSEPYSYPELMQPQLSLF